MSDKTMGNQQDKRIMTEADFAWLAGMLNGDGCFAINFVKRNASGGKFDLSLTLTQCDPCLIERATDILNSIGINPAIQEYKPGTNGVRNKYNLRINKMAHIAATIDAIINYMAGEKQAQAKLMRRYIERRIKYSDHSMRRNGASVLYDKEAIDIAREFYQLRGAMKYWPSDILNDYPAREYGQAARSA